MTAGPPTTLEGWLTKDKKSKGFGFGSSETRRWFKVKAITPDPGSKRSGGPAKMALCYYKSDRDREPRGWMFLRDITAVREAGPKCFVVEHPSRSYVLHAATTGEHADWVAGLKELVADAQGATKAKPAPSKAPPKKLEDPALYEYGSLYDDGRGEPPRDRYDDDHDRYRGDADARRRDDDRDRDRGYDGSRRCCYYNGLYLYSLGVRCNLVSAGHEEMIVNCLVRKQKPLDTCTRNRRTCRRPRWPRATRTCTWGPRQSSRRSFCRPARVGTTGPAWGGTQRTLHHPMYRT